MLFDIRNTWVTNNIQQRSCLEVLDDNSEIIKIISCGYSSEVPW